MFYSRTVDFDESPEEAAFRAEARGWLETAADSEPARGLAFGIARGDARVGRAGEAVAGVPR